MRSEQENDKKDENILLLSYDLQNVVTLAKADISSFFYKKKTEHLQLDCEGY